MRISTRLIVLLVTAVVAVMAVYALVTVSRTQDRLNEELLKMAEHISMALGVGVLHHLEKGDVEGVKEVLEAMSRYEDVKGAAVFNPAGDLVAATESIGTEMQGVRQPYAEPMGMGQRIGAPAESYTYVMGIKSNAGEIVGSLRLIVGEHSLLPYVFEARDFILYTIVVLTLVITVLIVFFSQSQIANPLKTLTFGAEAIGQGRLNHRIAVDKRGEIGTLATAFNQMAANLEATNREMVADREFIKNVVDSISEGIVVLDRQEQITGWNRTMEERYGLSLEDVLEKPLKEVLPDLYDYGFHSAFQRLLKDGTAEFDLDKVRLAKLSDRLFSVTGSVLWNAQSQITGAVLVLDDVTERVRIEQQIQQSEKLAAVGQLAAGVAHEIGTPLNVISGNAEYLLMDMKGEGDHAAELQAIVSETGRIAELVKQLMAFARRDEPQSEAVAAGELIHSILVLLRRQIDRQGIRTEVILEPDLKRIKGDQDQIRQVLLNLIINAWQAMLADGVLKVTGKNCIVELPKQQQGLNHQEEWVELKIEDTGMGIPENLLPKIFEPFFTTKDVGQGTGLGLAVVSRIVENHGGKIEVESRQGEGSVFTIVLPAVGKEGSNA